MRGSATPRRLRRPLRHGCVRQVGAAACPTRLGSGAWSGRTWSSCGPSQTSRCRCPRRGQQAAAAMEPCPAMHSATGMQSQVPNKSGDLQGGSRSPYTGCESPAHVLRRIELPTSHSRPSSSLGTGVSGGSRLIVTVARCSGRQSLPSLRSPHQHKLIPSNLCLRPATGFIRKFVHTCRSCSYVLRPKID